VTPFRGRIVERPKVEVTSPIRPGDHQAQNPQSTISHIFGTGKPTNFKLGIWMEYDMCGDLKAEML